MRKIFFIVIALAFATGLKAQKGFHVGGILGIGQSSFNSGALANQTNLLMKGGGATGTYHFNDYFGLLANVWVVAKGTRATGTIPGNGVFSSPEDYEETYHLTYAEIPIMAKLRYGGKGFYGKIFGGPSFNFNLGGTYDIDYKSSSNKDMSGQKINNVKVMETALVYGAGFEVETKEAGLYSLEFRMSQGLSDVAKTSMANNNIRNQYFAICLSWSVN